MKVKNFLKFCFGFFSTVITLANLIQANFMLSVSGNFLLTAFFFCIVEGVVLTLVNLSYRKICRDHNVTDEMEL